MSDLTAHALDPGKPLGALTAGFLEMLPSCLDTVDGVAAAGLAEQALDLLALAISSETEQNVVALSSSRAAALHRLKFEIEARLADPDLKPSTVAEAAGISVRYANALAVGGRHVTRALYRRSGDSSAAVAPSMIRSRHGESIGEIAYGWGFSDLSHFARRFKSAFGSSPSDYRRRRA